MRILFTGASSFTGFWFVKALSAAGHRVTAIFTRTEPDYDGLRGERVRLLEPLAERVFTCSFGSARFLELVRAASSWDVLCHHAADVTNYKSPDFDFLQATAHNCQALPQVFAELQERGLRAVIMTGSVFEANEGAGEPPLRAFSPYGLSKTLTWEVLKYYASAAGLKAGKFVIPNPFGPWEEPRFTAYLVRSWRDGKRPTVKTPAYIRDNVPVQLLATVYAQFVRRVVDGGEALQRLNPSGYVESQGAFTGRCAAALRERLRLACDFELAEQTDFAEPLMRVNTEPAWRLVPGWDAAKAWDELAEFYTRT